MRSVDIYISEKNKFIVTSVSTLLLLIANLHILKYYHSAAVPNLGQRVGFSVQ